MAASSRLNLLGDLHVNGWWVGYRSRDCMSSELSPGTHIPFRRTDKSGMTQQVAMKVVVLVLQLDETTKDYLLWNLYWPRHPPAPVKRPASVVDDADKSVDT